MCCAALIDALFCCSGLDDCVCEMCVQLCVAVFPCWRSVALIVIRMLRCRCCCDVEL